MLLFSNFKSKEHGLIALKIMSVFGAFLSARYLYARYMRERFGFELY
ncbi:hypothetical protein [Helicobacter pylori]|nr:hypothetical protein [Helicobacter pylori]